MTTMGIEDVHARKPRGVWPAMKFGALAVVVFYTFLLHHAYFSGEGGDGSKPTGQGTVTSCTAQWFYLGLRSACEISLPGEPAPRSEEGFGDDADTLLASRARLDGAGVGDSVPLTYEKPADPTGPDGRPREGDWDVSLPSPRYGMAFLVEAFLVGLGCVFAYLCVRDFRRRFQPAASSKSAAEVEEESVCSEGAIAAAESVEARPSEVGRKPDRPIYDGLVLLALGAFGAHAFWLLSRWDEYMDPHAPERYYVQLKPLFQLGVPLFCVTAALLITGLWKFGRGMYALRDENTRAPAWLSAVGRGIRWFFRKQRTKGRPVREWCVWLPLVMALLCGYSAYFTYGLSIADTTGLFDKVSVSEESGPDGRLMIESCRPNWAMLGLRSYCEGTITRVDVVPGADTTVHHVNPFSHFDDSDVGTEVPMLHGVLKPPDTGWIRQGTPDVAEQMVPFLFLLALGGLFVCRAIFIAVVRGGSALNAWLRAGKPPASKRTQLIRIWAAALLLGYAAYFVYGLCIAGDEVSDGTMHIAGRVIEKQPDGYIVVESCNPNWSMLGLRSECVGTVYPGRGVDASAARYDRDYSQFGAADVGKKVPMILDHNSEWQPMRGSDPPLWAGLFVLPLCLASLFAGIRGVGIAAGAAEKRNEDSASDDHQEQTPEPEQSEATR